MALDWLKLGTRGAGMGLSRLGFDPVGIRASFAPSAGDFLGGGNSLIPDRLGMDPTGIRGMSRGFGMDSARGSFSDPTGIRGTSRDLGLTGYLADKWGFPATDPSGFGAYLAKEQAKIEAAAGISTTPAGNPGGLASPSGDKWSGVNQWNDAIAAAAAKTGVPANLIKAVMQFESGGNAQSVSVAGATGLMQVMPFWNGTWGLSIYDPVQNVEMGARILKDNYDRYGNWDTAINAYFGFGPSDAYGTTGPQYIARVRQNWNELNAMGSSSGVDPTTFGGNPQAGASGSYATIFGGRSYPVSFEFRGGGGPDLYGYGLGYGLNGSEHTGLDVGTPLGTTMYAPMGGTVTCAGTGRGSGSYGSGCAAFNDYMGQGAGRVEVLLDNGVTLIYGHSSTSLVSPGQRVQAGTPVATSGGMNGAHVHLEARVRDASKDSGWRIIDPRSALGAGNYAAVGAPPGSGGGFSSAPVAMTQQDIIMSLMRGQRPPGY